MRAAASLTKKKFRASSTADPLGLLKIGTVRKLSHCSGNSEDNAD